MESGLFSKGAVREPGCDLPHSDPALRRREEREEGKGTHQARWSGEEPLGPQEPRCPGRALCSRLSGSSGVRVRCRSWVVQSLGKRHPDKPSPKG